MAGAGGTTTRWSSVAKTDFALSRRSLSQSTLCTLSRAATHCSILQHCVAACCRIQNFLVVQMYCVQQNRATGVMYGTCQWHCAGSWARSRAHKGVIQATILCLLLAPLSFPHRDSRGYGWGQTVLISAVRLIVAVYACEMSREWGRGAVVVGQLPVCSHPDCVYTHMCIHRTVLTHSL